MRISVPANYPVLTFCFILLFTCAPLQVKGQSATYRITIHKQNVTLESVFEELKKQTGLTFNFSNDVLDQHEIVSVDFRKVLLEVVLANLLIRKGLIWKPADGQITIGRGVDKDLLKYLDTTQDNRMSDTVMHINMDEVVVAGYKQSTRKLVTGNVIPAVRAPEIQPQFQCTGNIVTDLQGRVTGLQITMSGGIFGTPIDIRIRGKLSLSNGTVPLIVVDGIPIKTQITEGLGSSVWGALASALGYINPADVECIDVLKDADATAIYGSRGANGVIIVTTKRGRKGPGNLFVNFRSGIANVPRRYHMLNTSEYLQMRRDGFENDKIVPTPDNAPDLTTWDPGRYTNWQKDLIGRTANFYNTQAAFSGGNDTIQYYLGTNYQKNGTVFPGRFYQEGWGFHLNVSRGAPQQRLHLSGSWSYFNVHSFLPGNDFMNFIFLPPNTPEVYTDGELNYSFVNPYVGLIGPLFTANVYNRFGNIVARYRFLKGLVATLLLGDQLLKGNSQTITPIGMIAPALRDGVTGSTTIYGYRAGSTILEPQMAYTDTLGNWKLDVMVGGTYNGASEKRTKMVASGFKDDADYGNLVNATSITVNNYKSEYRYLACYGRAGVNLRDKYLLNLSIRRDGNSRFGTRERYATFWGIGAGWIFTGEHFTDSIKKVLSFGKIRMSYGTTGNDQVGGSQYTDQYSPVENYQGAGALISTSLANQDLSWEKTRKLEVAIDVGFWNDRWMVSGCYYRYRSTDQLANSPLPAMTGMPGIVRNIPAVILNDGWEFETQTQNLVTNKFSWSSVVNISIPRNKLLAYPGANQQVGESLNAYFAYQLAGVDPVNGTYQFLDANGNKVSAAENVPRPNNINLAPAYYGSVQHTFRYTGWRLDMVFMFVKQTGLSDIYDGVFVPGTQRNQDKRAIAQYWRSEGQTAIHQRMSAGGLRSSYLKMMESNMAYVNSSYIRCQTITLSRRLPLKRLHLVDGNLYVQGQNLFTITPYQGIDPETRSRTRLPLLRSFNVGIQLQI